MRIRKIFLILISALLVLAVGTGAYLFKHTKNQGLSDNQLKAYSKANIQRDHRGVISIRASNWLSLAEAQGFVTASERMFQLDLMRRRADGALAEIFGPVALTFDRRQRMEDWRHYAKAAADQLPDSQKKLCDAYARGVNEFLTEYPTKAGIEYTLLRQAPQSWSCVDSLLIVLLMSNNMSHSWSRDLDMKAWHDSLPKEWWSFVFPSRHPWNRPWFENSTDKLAQSLWPTTELPYSQLSDSDFQPAISERQAVIDGSNSWAYRGKKGAWLANDPHLGNQVPQLWIPMKLVTDDGWWAVGSALPGVAGILIGMNNSLAWAITNNGEDVDDAVIAAEGIQVEEEKRKIAVRGGKEEILVVRKTDKGPIVKDSGDGTFIIRQWIALKPGILSLPIETLNRSLDWESFNQALDQFRFVPLNFTMLDRHGNMGLRISGCDIGRGNNGDFAESWEQSTWALDCKVDQRRRLFIPKDAGETAYISTANEQIWIDGKLHNWADDDRAFRLRELLGKNDLGFEDMGMMQLDTVSHIHARVLRWLLDTGMTEGLPQDQKNDWQKWDGNIKSCPQCMSEANDGALLLDQIIMKKIEHQFTKGDGGLPKVRRNMDRARVVALIENPNVATLLGFDPKALASGVIKSLMRTPTQTRKEWQIRNQWATQHPFVGRVPVVGRLFEIDAPLQYGASTVLRAEKPHHGPSTRMIWSPGRPETSVWAFPTGTSGHIFSPHFKDWSNIWQTGGLVAIPSTP
jgi:penicillin amidase